MLLSALVFALGSLVSMPSIQQGHHGPDQRFAAVMGFDQAQTAHHFLLFADGGAIDVSANDRSDIKNRDAIRAHLPHIAMMFGNGDFNAPMLVHDSANVPGTKVMAARKEAISYQYVETPTGGRVNIVSTDRQAIAAVHEFLKFQITEHKTGDPMTVRSR